MNTMQKFFEYRQEAVEAAIKSMPKWQPATYGGIAVPFEKNIKVEF